MALFYDPKNKKVKIWSLSAFILIPILAVVFVWMAGRKAAEKKKVENAQEKDIFN